MTERAVFRFVRWTVAPDREPDAEPITYAMQCAVCGMRYAVCGRQSKAFVEIGPAQDWTLRHTARARGHHSYREIITRPWRAWATDGGQQTS